MRLIPAPSRRKVLAPLGLLAGVLASVLVVIGSGDRARADEPPAGRTDVALTTDAPIREGRNALWCATIQLAWDAAADVAGKDGRLEVGPPAPAEAVAALNRRTFPHADLDEASTLVVGGLVRDGVLDRLRAAFVAKFPGETPPAIEAAPEDAIGFAALRKDLPFETPFRVHPEGMTFSGGSKPVRAFGMLPYDQAPDVKAMASQVTVWFAKDPSEAYRGEDWRPVAELQPKGGGDRILLSALEPGPTLETAWKALSDRLAAGHGKRLDDAEDLAVPRVRLDLAHRFAELVGAPLANVPGGFLREVRQTVRFSLTEKGAAVASDALVQPAMGIGVRLVFDRPFLLALLRKDATRPYLLLWVGNEDLLESAVPPRPAKGAAVAPYSGTWTADLDRMLDEEADRQVVGMTEPLEDPEHPGTPLPPEAARALLRRLMAEWAHGFAASLEVGEDGRFAFRASLDALKGAWLDGALTVAGRLVVDEGRVMLWPETESGKSVLEGEAAATLLPLRLADGFLRLNVPELPLLVLRRR